ncbi:phosphotransferase family protein [Planomonospora algeriensis]
MARLQWDDLPSVVRDAVQTECGPVLKAESATDGLMPGAALHLRIEGGSRVFLKALPADGPAVRLYERERWAGEVLPAAVPAPRMRWSSDIGGWITMLFEHIDGRAADLSPASPDVPAVLDTVARLERLLTPSPAAAAPLVADNVEQLLVKGRHLMAKPNGVLPHRDLYVAVLDGFDVEDLAGDTLLHYDLHVGNLQITPGGVRVIDWGFAAAGAAWIDAFMLGPRLIEAGHTPAQTENLLTRVPAWQEAPATAVNGLLAAWTLFRVYKAMYGPDEGREFRARAAAAGRVWLAHRARNV